MTESTNHLRTLVDLNNEAVAAFRKGQTELARAKMKEAVQWSQQIVVRCEENCDDKVYSSLSANEKYSSFSSRAATTMTDRDMIVLLVVRTISIDDNGLNSNSGPFSTGQEERHPLQSILDRKYRLPFLSMATSSAMLWPKSYFTNMFVVHIQMPNEEEEKSPHQNGGRVTFESHPPNNQQQTRRSAAYTKDHEDAFTTIVSCVLFNTALACQCLSRQSSQQRNYKRSENHEQKAMRLYQLCISTLLISKEEEEPSSSHDQAKRPARLKETGNPLGNWSSDVADSGRNPPPLSSRTRRMPPEEEQQQDYLQDAFTNQSRSLADKKRFILAACLNNLYMATFVKETPASAST